MAEEMTQEQLITAASDATVARLLKAGVLNPATPKRKRYNWERVLAYEYTTARYPTSLKWFRTAVGDYKDSKKNDLYAGTRRYADIIIKERDKIIIVECKMAPKTEAIGQVIDYAARFPSTPEFQELATLKVVPRIVVAMDSKGYKETCESNGIEYEVFKPSNYDLWYKYVILHEKE